MRLFVLSNLTRNQLYLRMISRMSNYPYKRNGDERLGRTRTMMVFRRNISEEIMCVKNDRGSCQRIRFRTAAQQ